MDIGGKDGKVKDKRVRELGSIITVGQSGEKPMLGSIGDDANISEPELSCRRDRNGEIHRGSVSGPSCVRTVTQDIQGKTANVPLETTVGEREDRGQKRTGRLEA